MKPRRTLKLLVLLAAMLAAPTNAAASIGTGVGALPLVLRTPAKAGRIYSLPPLYVKNTGSVSSLYTVKVERLSQDAQRTVPPAWVHVSPATFPLRPGVLRRIAVKVAIPAGANPASYTTDLVASTTTAHSPGVTALGAAAADKISFQVPSTTALPWLPIALGGALLGLALAGWAIRRTGLHPRIRLSWRAA